MVEVCYTSFIYCFIAIQVSFGMTTHIKWIANICLVLHIICFNTVYGVFVEHTGYHGEGSQVHLRAEDIL